MEYKQAIEDWQKKLFEKGWIAPNWPKEHGGTGWTVNQKYIYETERSLAGIPSVVTSSEVLAKLVSDPVIGGS